MNTPQQTLQEMHKITEAEKEVIIAHIAERFKSFVFITAEQRTKEILDELWDERMIPADCIRLTFSMIQVVGDIEVALGEHRRKYES